MTTLEQRMADYVPRRAGHVDVPPGLWEDLAGGQVSRFNPEERRDFHGRWAKSGSGPARKAEDWLASTLHQNAPLQFRSDALLRSYEQRHLEPIRAPYNDQHKAALRAYRDSDGPLDERTTRTITGVMDGLPDSLMLTRWAPAESVAHLNTGDVISSDSLTSTTLRPGLMGPPRAGTTVVQILAPKDTPVALAPDGPAADEVILHPQQSYAVISRRERRPGVEELNLVALPSHAWLR